MKKYVIKRMEKISQQIEVHAETKEVAIQKAIDGFGKPLESNTKTVRVEVISEQDFTEKELS